MLFLQCHPINFQISICNIISVLVHWLIHNVTWENKYILKYECDRLQHKSVIVCTKTVKHKSWKSGCKGASVLCLDLLKWLLYWKSNDACTLIKLFVYKCHQHVLKHVSLASHDGSSLHHLLYFLNCIFQSCILLSNNGWELDRFVAVVNCTQSCSSGLITKGSFILLQLKPKAKSSGSVHHWLEKRSVGLATGAAGAGVGGVGNSHSSTLCHNLYSALDCVRVWNPSDTVKHTHHGGIFNFDFTSDG